MTTSAMPLVPLGACDLTVSRLSLGSWRTYERISREQGVAVMRFARDAGINFLDDARYNDETGRAPIPTGYSEIVFGELFKAAGWRRDETIVSNKLWWEFWPDERPAQELAGSLERMGLDYIDLIYSEMPPADLPFEDAVEMINGLISTGIARAWGTLNWTPEAMERAWQIARASDVPGPVATQPPYSLVSRQAVEDPAMTEVTRRNGIAIVASYALAGGVLTGKYDADPQAGRATGALDSPRYAASLTAGRALAEFAKEVGRDPAQLAVAFALANPTVTTVLFGATKPEQIAINVGALDVVQELSSGELTRLRAIGA